MVLASGAKLLMKNQQIQVSVLSCFTGPQVQVCLFLHWFSSLTDRAVTRCFNPASPCAEFKSRVVEMLMCRNSLAAEAWQDVFMVYPAAGSLKGYFMELI